MEYTDLNRGEIQFPDRAKQIISFSGLNGLFGNITPTDIDGVIEYHNKGYVILEFKYKNAQIPDGQRIAIERMVDDFRRSKKEAVAFLCSHDVTDTSKCIDAASAIVKCRYYNGKWKMLNGNKTVRWWTENFINCIDSERKKNGN